MTIHDRLVGTLLRWVLNCVLNFLVLVGILRHLTRVKRQPRYQFHLEKAPHAVRSMPKPAGPVVVHTTESNPSGPLILQEETRLTAAFLASQRPRRNRGAW